MVLLLSIYLYVSLPLLYLRLLIPIKYFLSFLFNFRFRIICSDPFFLSYFDFVGFFLIIWKDWYLKVLWGHFLPWHPGYPDTQVRKNKIIKGYSNGGYSIWSYYIWSYSIWSFSVIPFEVIAGEVISFGLIPFGVIPNAITPNEIQ